MLDPKLFLVYSFWTLYTGPITKHYLNPSSKSDAVDQSKDAIPNPSFTYTFNQSEDTISELTTGKRPRKVFIKTTVPMPYLHEVQANPGILDNKDLFPYVLRTALSLFNSPFSPWVHNFFSAFNEHSLYLPFLCVLSNLFFRIPRNRKEALTTPYLATFLHPGFFLNSSPMYPNSTS